MPSGHILVADDDAGIRTVLNQALTRAGYEVRSTGTVAGLWRWVAAGEGDLVITDVVMPDDNAFDLLPRIKRMRPDLPIIVMSAQNTFITAIKASERGAYEYLPKPFDLRELVAIVGRALAEPKRRREDVEAAPVEVMPIVGRSPAMQDIFRVLARLMQTDLTVMISGESGTGKELVARALHDYGKRKGGPFVAINMAAIPRDLIESELFGHEKGAFTGAAARSVGRFEQAEGRNPVSRRDRRHADGGPDAPSSRAAAGRIYDRRGPHADQDQRQDRRRDQQGPPLRHPAGGFSRGSVFPPQRRADPSSPLARAPGGHSRPRARLLPARFRGGASGQDDRARGHGAPAALPWPGNVRELENLTRRLAALYPQDVIGEALIEAELSAGASPLFPPPAVGEEGWKRVAPASRSDRGDGFDAAMERAVADLFRSFGGANPQVGLYHRVLHDLEAPLIAATLTWTRGNQIKAAEILGLNRNTLRKKIRDLNLRGVASFR